MSEELAVKLNNCTTKGYVLAPAGYGKTHLIAMAVKASRARQLVLTHTFAGVSSIKSKMAALGVPASRYQVDTIASWSLRLCLAYPKTADWDTEHPTNEQWATLYDACTRLLGKQFARDVVTATYSGVYVDEYQDCSDLQHALIRAIAAFMPARILGDPMQAIFDFEKGKPVDWEKSVYPEFECLGRLETPWRWEKAGAQELGTWLKEARNQMERGLKVDLLKNRPPSVVRVYASPEHLSAVQYSTLCNLLGHQESVVALHGGGPAAKNETHRLARMLAGRFSSIEEVEGKDLHAILRKIETSKNVKVGFVSILEFAKKCFTGVADALTSGTKKGDIAKETKATKYPLVLRAANAYLGDPTSSNLRSFFIALKDNPKTSAYRRDLLYRFLNVLNIHIESKAMALTDAGKLYQRELRHTGRPISHRKLVATTLLVKGLEYDHAVILYADSLDDKDLYVAMTRGAKSLTLIGASRHLPVR